MKSLCVIFICSLILASCAPRVQDTPPTTTLPGSVSTGMVSTGSNLPENVSIAPGEVKDFSISLTDGVGAVDVEKGTGSKLNLRFSSFPGKKILINLETPNDSMANIRVNQIIFPDGKSDGPFGRDFDYELTQTGEYQVIIGESLMANPWAGKIEVRMSIE